MKRFKETSFIYFRLSLFNNFIISPTSQIYRDPPGISVKYAINFSFKQFWTLFICSSTKKINKILKYTRGTKSSFRMLRIKSPNRIYISLGISSIVGRYFFFRVLRFFSFYFCSLPFIILIYITWIYVSECINPSRRFYH